MKNKKFFNTGRKNPRPKHGDESNGRIVYHRKIMFPMKTRILSGFVAAMTIASPVLSYAADMNGYETVSESADALSAETETIVGSDGENTAETKFLFINLEKATGGKVIINEGLDDQKTLRLEAESGIAYIDEYDKDDVLIARNEAIANNYVYVYEAQADSIVNMKVVSDEGYVLTNYTVSDNSDSGEAQDENEMKSPSSTYTYPVLMSDNVSIGITFTKVEEESSDLTVNETEKGPENTDSENEASNSETSGKTGDLSVNDEASEPTDSEDNGIPSNETTDSDNSAEDLTVADTPDESDQNTDEDSESMDDASATDDIADSADTDAADEKGTAAEDTTDESIPDDSGEHFLDTMSGTEELNASDFSTSRLIVLAEDIDTIIDTEHLVGNYDNIYLLQYKTPEQAMNAYMYYLANASAVEPDAKIMTASEDSAAGEYAVDDMQTASENALAVLSENEMSASAIKSSNVIALIDTGTAEGKNIIDRVSMIDDVLVGNGHGDIMAKAIVSQNKNAQILSIRALGNDGYGSYSAVVSAIEYAINSNVDIINLSMYSKKTLETSILEAEIEKAVQSGITVVGAAGNDGADVSDYIPGGIDDVYTIGAVNGSGARRKLSNYGSLVDYYVTAESTSEAAALFTGYVSANGLDAADSDETGFIYKEATEGGYENDDVDVNDKDPDMKTDLPVIFDPIIENYVRDNADNSLVGDTHSKNDDLYIMNVLDVKAIVADENELNEGETIASLNKNGGGFRFLTQQVGRVPVYDFSPDSKYFVAFADVMHNDKSATALDISVAENNIEGHSIEGFRYDKDTGLLYIPKTAYLDSEGKYSIGFLQTQILYSISGYSVSSQWNSAAYTVTEQDGDTVDTVDTNIEGDDIFLQVMNVKVGKYMDVNDMLVCVNGYPIDGHLYEYDPSTGNMVLAFSSVAVQSVWVKAHKTEDAPAVEPGMKAAIAKDCTLSSMSAFSSTKLKLKSTNGFFVKGKLWAGAKTKIGYTDKRGYDLNTSKVTYNRVFAYRGFVNDVRADLTKNSDYGKVYTDYIFNTEKNKSGSIGKYNGHLTAAQIRARLSFTEYNTSTPYVYYGDLDNRMYTCVMLMNTIGTGNDYSMDFSSFKSNDMLVMECTHVDAPSSWPGWSNNVNMDPGFIWSKIALKLVAFNNTSGQPWAVFAVYTDEMNSQHGTGLFKVYVDASAKLTIDKQITVWQMTQNCPSRYASKINTSFTLFSDSGCNKAVKTLSLVGDDKSNVASATVTVNPGTYYVKETKTIQGTATNDKVYGPIKLLAGDSKNLKDFIKESDREKMNMTKEGRVANVCAFYRGILLKKVSKIGNIPLKGGIFRVQYSPYGNDGTHKFNTERTWYFMTDSNGEIKYDKAHLVDNVSGYNGYYKGKSSKLFYTDAAGTDPVLPFCVLRVKEVVAPSGYVVDDTEYSLWTRFKPIGTNKYDTTDFHLVLNKELIVKETQVYSSWKLQANVKKVDKNGKGLAGAVFGIWDDPKCNEGEKEALAYLTTGSNGMSGTYKIDKIPKETTSKTLYCKELVAPEGCVKTDRVYSLTWQKSEFDNLYKTDTNTNGQTQTFGGNTGIINEPPDWYVSAYTKKIDSLGNALAGAKFGIYDNADCNEYSQVGTIISGEDGITNTASIGVSRDKKEITLYCKEIEAPKGYTLIDEVYSQTWQKADYTEGDTTGETKMFGPADGIVNDAGWPVSVFAKKVGKTKNALQGAEFKVYTDAALTKEVGTLISGEDGVTNTLTIAAKSSEPIITLYCKETKAPTGCTPTSEVFQQTFTKADYDALGDVNGETKQFGPTDGIVNDDSWKAKFKAKKIDENGNALEGATFEVYSDKECTNVLTTLTSGEDGWTSEESIDVDGSKDSLTLYCKETEAPDGYVVSDEVFEQTWQKADYWTEFNKDNDVDGESKLFGPENGIVNKLPASEWSIQYQVKKIAQDGTPLKDAEFGVYTDKDCTEESQIGSLITDEEGMTEILSVDEIDGNTDSVTIYCKETAAPEEYYMTDEVFSLTYTKDDYEKEVQNGNEDGQLQVFAGNDGNGIVNEKMEAPVIKIHKTSSAPSDILGLSGYNVEGAEFLIRSEFFSAIVTTDKDGDTEPLELPSKSGIYDIIELTAPAGHKIAEPQTMTVTMPDDAGKNFEFSFEDEPAFVEDEFKITKTSTKGNPIEGVVFKTEFLDGELTEENPDVKVVKTWYLVSDADGVVTMDDAHLSKDSEFKSDEFYKYKDKVVIPIGGTLRVTEVRAPGQYIVDSTPKVFETLVDTVFEDELGTVVNDLAPAKLRIKKYDSDGATPLKGVTFKLEYLEETEKTAETATGYTRLLKVGESTEAATDENGEITWENLDQGKYRITETSTVAGHTLLTKPIEVTLPISITEEEAKANDADMSKGVLDKGYTGNWLLYDCLYEITNSATFKLPMTGGNGTWTYVAVGFGALAAMGAGLVLLTDSRKKHVRKKKSNQKVKK